MPLPRRRVKSRSWKRELRLRELLSTSFLTVVRQEWTHPEVLVCATVILSVCVPLPAQSSLSRSDYLQQLSAVEQRNEVLRQEIAHEQALVLELKNKLGAARSRIDSIRTAYLNRLGITEQDVAAAIMELSGLNVQCSTLFCMSDKQFMEDSLRIISLRTGVDALSGSPAAKLRTVSEKLAPVKESVSSLEGRFAALMDSTAFAQNQKTAPMNEESRMESYTVRRIDGRPESLSAIAERVYGDPGLWPRIFDANKTEITGNFAVYSRQGKMAAYKNPSDLIFPGQVLKIPR